MLRERHVERKLCRVPPALRGRQRQPLHRRAHQHRRQDGAFAPLQGVVRALGPLLVGHDGVVEHHAHAGHVDVQVRRHDAHAHRLGVRAQALVAIAHLHATDLEADAAALHGMQAATDPVGAFQHLHPRASGLQGARRGQAGQAGTDHDHVHVHIARRLPGLQPAGGTLAAGQAQGEGATGHALDHITSLHRDFLWLPGRWRGIGWSNAMGGPGAGFPAPVGAGDRGPSVALLRPAYARPARPAATGRPHAGRWPARPHSGVPACSSFR